MDKIKTYDRLLRDTLKSLLKAQYERRDDRNFANKLYDDIIKALNTPDEAEPDNGWISVKDRLPENDDKYMVWYKGECDICEFDVESQTFGYTYDDYDEMYSHLVCWDDGMNKDVTHWQLLPEPPKGE